MVLDRGFDLLADESRQAISVLASRGTWRLTLGKGSRRCDRLTRARPAGTMMRIVHAIWCDREIAEDPDVLLDEWRTLIDVAAAVVEAGAEVTLVQSFSRDR